MPRKNPPAKWVLPKIVHPTKTRCFTIEVPDERFYIAAFRGALLNLAAAYHWQDDSAHTARDVARVWRSIVDRVTGCTPPPLPGRPGIYIEDTMSSQIRIKPENTCIIQMWCIDHWEDWYDPTRCIPGSVGNPSPAGDLAAGECRSYSVVLNGSSQWILPVALEDGDTFTVSNMQGGWNDGTLQWYCPSGSIYGLGVCTGSPGHDGGDPDAVGYHMQLLGFLDGIYYPIVDGGVVAVPTGTAASNLTFRANDATLSDNTGSVSFDITVCRNPAPVESYGISYAYGSGPGSVIAGSVVSITAAARSVVPSNTAYNIELSISPCAKLEILSAPGWTDTDGAGPNVSWNCEDCSSTPHEVFPPATLIPTFGNQECTTLGINSVTPFSITFRLTPA